MADRGMFYGSKNGDDALFKLFPKYMSLFDLILKYKVK